MRTPQNLLFLDTETTGLEWFAGHRPFLVGLANAEGEQEIIDLRASGPTAELVSLLEDTSVTKVGHNLGFDVHMLRSSGFTISGPICDTELLARYCFPGQESYALKALARSVLKLETKNEADLKTWLAKETRNRRSLARKGGTPFVEPTYADVPREIIEPYLRDDLVYTATLAGLCRRRISGPLERLLELEHEVLAAKIRMEERGVYCDVAYFRERYDEAKKKIADLEAEMQTIVGRDFSWRSSKQLGAIFAGDLGLPSTVVTEKGSPSYGREGLAGLDHPLARKIEEARGLHKLAETYYKGLADIAVDNVIHPSFRQHGAITGRFSCADPNLQNIPRRDTSVRRGFVCRAGYSQLYIDYEQIEWKIFAHYAEDEKILDPVRRGVDGHIATAGLLFNRDVDKKHPLRQVCKTLNFALIYGAGHKKIAEQIRELLKHEDPALMEDPALKKLASISDAQTKVLLSKYHNTYPGVRKLVRSLEKDIRCYGRVTDIFGKDYWVPADEAYKAANYLVQGSAALVMKRGLARAERYVSMMRELGIQVWIVNVVHDELQVEVEKNAWEREGNKIVSRLVAALEDRSHFAVPISCDVAISHTNWAEKEKLEKLEELDAVHSKRSA